MSCIKHIITFNDISYSDRVFFKYNVYETNYRRNTTSFYPVIYPRIRLISLYAIVGDFIGKCHVYHENEGVL